MRFISFINLYLSYSNCRQNNLLHLYLYLIILNIHFILYHFVNASYSYKINFFIIKKNSRLLTIQRSPMAHRRWSQEQYKICSYYWIVQYQYMIRWFWINYAAANVTYFNYYYLIYWRNLSTSILQYRLMKCWVDIHFILFY